MQDAVYFEENPINSAIEYKEDMVFALNFGDEIQLADMNINLDARPYDMQKAYHPHGNVLRQCLWDAKYGSQRHVDGRWKLCASEWKMSLSSALFSRRLCLLILHRRKKIKKNHALC